MVAAAITRRRSNALSTMQPGKEPLSRTDRVSESLFLTKTIHLGHANGKNCMLLER